LPMNGWRPWRYYRKYSTTSGRIQGERLFGETTTIVKVNCVIGGASILLAA
jgi:hypothetical protein